MSHVASFPAVLPNHHHRSKSELVWVEATSLMDKQHLSLFSVLIATAALSVVWMCAVCITAMQWLHVELASTNYMQGKRQRTQPPFRGSPQFKPVNVICPVLLDIGLNFAGRQHCELLLRRLRSSHLVVTSFLPHASSCSVWGSLCGDVRTFRQMKMKMTVLPRPSRENLGVLVVKTVASKKY